MRLSYRPGFEKSIHAYVDATNNTHPQAGSAVIGMKTQLPNFESSQLPNVSLTTGAAEMRAKRKGIMKANVITFVSGSIKRKCLRG
jgi:hypothetical protein